MISRRMSVVTLTLLAFSAVVIAGGKGLAAETPYYQGKTITILEARSPGGTGSLRTQSAAKYLSKHLPGNPSIVYQFMPGGGGALAMNHLFGSVRKDGLTIGNVSSAAFGALLTGRPEFKFRLEQVRWLGTATSGTPTALVIRPALGLDSVEKLQGHVGLRFANRSVGHSMYVRDRLTALILELKEPRWILGYSDAEIRLALERGEADAQFGGIAGHVREAPEWFKEKGFTVPVILKNAKGEEAERYPLFPQGRPGVDQFADTPIKKALLAIYHAINSGSVFYIPNDIPEPALRALNEAFDRVWQDSEWAKEHEKLTNEAPDPQTGHDLHSMLAQVPKDPKIVDAFKQLISAGPLPVAR